MSRRPLFSVIVATYGRPQVLRQALLHLQRQTLKDWEGLVIGDACRDRTGLAVAGLKDRRLRFINLAQHHGEQSGPNNAGLALARGRYGAFLNHDDLWWPEHLAVLKKALDGDFQLAATLCLGIPPAGPHNLMSSSVIAGMDPMNFYPASSLGFRLDAGLGPWRPSNECYDEPSQDWIRRALGAGARTLALPVLTVLALQSGLRPGSYGHGDAEHRLWSRRMLQPGFRERELAQLASFHRAELEHWALARVADHGRHFLWSAWLAFLGKARGLHPRAAQKWWAFGRKKGAYVAQLKRMRGLLPEDKHGGT